MYFLYANSRIFLLPVALSILDARFIGILHFTIGFIITYWAFIVASSF